MSLLPYLCRVPSVVRDSVTGRFGVLLICDGCFERRVRTLLDRRHLVGRLLLRQLRLQARLLGEELGLADVSNRTGLALFTLGPLGLDALTKLRHLVLQRVEFLVVCRHVQLLSVSSQNSSVETYRKSPSI